MRKEKMKILIIHPDKEPEVKIIDDTLSSMQNIVGGYLKTSHFCSLTGRDLSLVCDEDSQYIHLPKNKYLDGIVGTAFICRDTGSELYGLTDHEIKICKDILILINLKLPVDKYNKSIKKAANDTGIS